MSSDSQAEKTEAVFARLVPTEKAALQAIAKAERRNVSETVRELIRSEAHRRGLWPGHPAKQEATK
jgi:hypothetical protein